MLWWTFNPQVWNWLRGLERIAASCGTWTLDSEPICGENPQTKKSCGKSSFGWFEVGWSSGIGIKIYKNHWKSLGGYLEFLWQIESLKSYGDFFSILPPGWEKVQKLIIDASQFFCAWKIATGTSRDPGGEVETNPKWWFSIPESTPKMPENLWWKFSMFPLKDVSKKNLQIGCCRI